MKRRSPRSTRPDPLFPSTTLFRSLIGSLAADLALADFDPLDCVLGEAWNGARPAAFGAAEGWRTKGDTVERLELLAAALVADECKADAGWTRTAAVLEKIEIGRAACRERVCQYV